MVKFRKKPVVIEAMQFDGTNFNELEDFGDPYVTYYGGKLTIDTLEGQLCATPGDWIIKGIKVSFTRVSLISLKLPMK